MDIIRNYRVAGQWTAVFIVMYLATFLMSHGYRRSLQNNNNNNNNLAVAATMHHRHEHNNNIAYPTSLMIHNGENYYHQPQQRSHHRRYHHHGGGTGGFEIQSNLRQHSFYHNDNNDGSIRPLPPLLRPHQRDDDYTEPNFGELDIYMLSEYEEEEEEEEHDDDGYEREQEENNEEETHRTATTGEHQQAAVLSLPLRREILEGEEDWRLDPDRFEHKFQRHGRPRPHYDDHYYHNDQYIPDVDKYPENEYYWYYAMDDDVKRNPYIGYVHYGSVRFVDLIQHAQRPVLLSFSSRHFFSSYAQTHTLSFSASLVLGCLA
jgi:hypothetical protein